MKTNLLAIAALLGAPFMCIGVYDSIIVWVAMAVTLLAKANARPQLTPERQAELV
ncbi:hypothetical protein [Dyadobacter luticola]|uniref:hypothetical protein n=1 Tax=Dyadobacter luticola TaxID=1979387 RepID=UPI0014862844|nr:hypothetical protein [Dyadobacter luticola]